LVQVSNSSLNFDIVFIIELLINIDIILYVLGLLNLTNYMI
jgi:hypothetical protein